MKATAKIMLALIIIVLVLNWNTISDLLRTNTSSITGKAYDMPTENSTETQVYFCPDNCIGEMISWLDAAQKSIHCALFEIELEELKEKLDEKSEKIDVKIITDNDYADQYVRSFVKDDNRSALMHNKFCVLDGTAVWTGSFNPTERGNYKNNNNAVFIESRNLADNYETEFYEMWDGTFGGGERNTVTELNINGHKIENYFCPEDWCANKVTYALQDAKRTIHFMTFSFTHDGIGDQIIEMAARGVEVKGVFEKSQNNKYTEYTRFIDKGINVRWDGNPANMHHKVFIIDGETVVSGSFNPTSNGDTKNDENVLIIHDPTVAGLYEKEFEKVWANQ